MELAPHEAALALMIRRIELRSALSDDDRKLIMSLPGQTRAVAAHRDLIRPGEVVEDACLVVAGVLAQFELTVNGARQLTALHVAGDLAGLNAVVLPKSGGGLTALTTARVYGVPRRALEALADRSPTLARAFWRECTVEASISQEWLLNLGRLDAQARVAHLLCELALRYEAVGYPRCAFPADLTQAQFADALGLTSIHVNRMIGIIRATGVAAVADRQVVISDWEELAKIGEFDPGYLHLEPTPRDRQTQ